MIHSRLAAAKLEFHAGNLLAMNGLSPGMDERNSGLSTSFRTPFFDLIDSMGHSRFVLRILILIVSLCPVPHVWAMAIRLTAVDGAPGI